MNARRYPQTEPYAQYECGRCGGDGAGREGVCGACVREECVREDAAREAIAMHATTTVATTTTLHVCCACGKRFSSVDCLANWCDRCVLHATQGRTARQVVANERIAVWTWGAVALFAVGVALVKLAGGL